MREPLYGFGKNMFLVTAPANLNENQTCLEGSR